jgi:hypothetical protein
MAEFTTLKVDSVPRSQYLEHKLDLNGWVLPSSYVWGLSRRTVTRPNHVPIPREGRHGRTAMLWKGSRDPLWTQAQRIQ